MSKSTKTSKQALKQELLGQFKIKWINLYEKIINNDTNNEDFLNLTQLIYEINNKTLTINYAILVNKFKNKIIRDEYCTRINNYINNYL